jgi:spermidine synthase
MPDGTLEERERGGRRILVQKSGSEIQLLFDSVESCEIQSRLDLDHPLDLRSPYTRGAMLGLLWSCPPRRVHVIGLGGGRIPLVLRHHFPEAVIDCSETDPEVTELATRFFGLRTDARLRVHHEDGRSFLERRDPSEPYDLILVDAFDGFGFGALRLATKEFLRCCRRQLAGDGTLALNLLPGDPLLGRKLATLGAAFSDAWLFEEEEGIIAFGRDGEALPRSELIRRARRLQRQSRFAFPLHRVARALGPLPSRYRGGSGGDALAELADPEDPG